MAGRSPLATAVALTLVVSTLGLAVFVALPPILGIDFAEPVPTGTYLAFLFVLYGTGLVVVVGYLRLADLGIGYLDWRVPTVRDGGYVVAGLVVDFVLVGLLSVAVSLLGLPGPPETVFTLMEVSNPTNLLAFVPFALLVNGPVEEILFRGLVQKSLYEQFSRTGAVFVASILFALFHLPVFYLVFLNPNPPLWGIAVALLLWFEGGLVLGALFALTDNLVVPALVHGLFNAIVSVSGYLAVA